MFKIIRRFFRFLRLRNRYHKAFRRLYRERRYQRKIYNIVMEQKEDWAHRYFSVREELAEERSTFRVRALKVAEEEKILWNRGIRAEFAMLAETGIPYEFTQNGVSYRGTFERKPQIVMQDWKNSFPIASVQPSRFIPEGTILLINEQKDKYGNGPLPRIITGIGENNRRPEAKQATPQREGEAAREGADEPLREAVFKPTDGVGEEG